MNFDLKKSWPLIVALLVGVFLYQRYRIPPKVDFPALQLTDEQGEAVDIQDYAGQVIFVKFWASWCAPCLQEMPWVEAARKELEPEGVVFITITDDSYEKLNKFKSNYPEYGFHTWKLDGKLKDLGIHTIPTTYIIDKEGQVAFEKVNPVDWRQAENQELLRNLLN